MVKISAKQQRMLEWVRGFIDERKYPPTMREIADGLGIASTNTVSYNLDRIEMAGLIERTPCAARGIRILEETDVRTAERNGHQRILRDDL